MLENSLRKENKMYLKINRTKKSFVQNFEIVERKGFGHPDTICDNLVESIAQRLEREYEKEYGLPQHYNIDKSLLVAGVSHPSYKGGKVLKPMKFIIGDRATYLPNNAIEKVCKEEVKKIITYFPGSQAITQVELKPTSTHLSLMFHQKLCNDTSAVVGYAPMTPTENLALEIEKLLLDLDVPFIGRDIKVMVVRRNGHTKIIVAIAFISRYIQSESDYYKKLEYVQNYLRIETKVKNIEINPDGVYMTVTGTSAECGDSGEVGRGNRYNGIIPLCRPMNSEAYHGKNSITHIGKIYNKMAFNLSEEIVNLGAKEAYVWMYGTIGKPLTNPEIIVSYYANSNLNKRIKDLCTMGVTRLTM